jgi:FkbM family methyltransferase
LSKWVGRFYRFSLACKSIGYKNAVKIFLIFDNKLNKLHLFGHDFWYRGKSDSGVLSHFYKTAYVIKDDKSEKKIKTIIDAGANIGDETFRFVMHNSKATIIAIEPQNENFEILKRNFENFNNVKLINKGLWSTKTRLKINQGGTTNESYFVTEVLGEDYDIDAYDIEYILDTNAIDEIDILKLDIECAEYELLNSNYEKWINKVNCFIFEVSDCEKSITQLLFKRLGDDYTSYISGENIVMIRNSTNWYMKNVIGFDKVN